MPLRRAARACRRGAPSVASSRVAVAPGGECAGWEDAARWVEVRARAGCGVLEVVAATEVGAVVAGAVVDTRPRPGRPSPFEAEVSASTTASTMAPAAPIPAASIGVARRRRVPPRAAPGAESTVVAAPAGMVEVSAAAPAAPAGAVEAPAAPAAPAPDSAAATSAAAGRSADSLAVMARSRPGQGAGSVSGISGARWRRAAAAPTPEPGKATTPVRHSSSTRPRE